MLQGLIGWRLRLSDMFGVDFEAKHVGAFSSTVEQARPANCACCHANIILRQINKKMTRPAIFDAAQPVNKKNTKNDNTDCFCLVHLLPYASIFCYLVHVGVLTVLHLMLCRQLLLLTSHDCSGTLKFSLYQYRSSSRRGRDFKLFSRHYICDVELFTWWLHLPSFRNSILR